MDKQLNSTSNIFERQPEWLEKYASGAHPWQFDQKEKLAYRRIGLVETFFDCDGSDYEGRADVTINIELECLCLLGTGEFQQLVQTAWAALRSQQLLLSAQCHTGYGFLNNPTNAPENRDRHFVIHQAKNVETAIERSSESLSFMSVKYTDLDAWDFYSHANNTARVLDPQRSLSHLFVAPLNRKHPSAKTQRLRMFLILAHSITDGLAMTRWTQTFIDLLNKPVADLRAEIDKGCSLPSRQLLQKLPLCQEDLYPYVAGTKARQRWHWAISRILRHVRHPPPRSFQNPLRRSQPLTNAVPPPPKYLDLLSYSLSRIPPPQQLPHNHHSPALHNSAPHQALPRNKDINRRRRLRARRTRHDDVL